MRFFKPISLPVRDLKNDTLISVGGITVNMTAAQLVTANPAQFFMDRTTYGEDRLCTLSLDQEKVEVVAEDAQQQQYTVAGENFEYVPVFVAVIGGHPTQPIGRPK